MGRVRKWTSLPAKERRLILEAWPLLWGIRLALWILPFRVIHGRVSRRVAGAGKGVASPEVDPDLVGRCIRRAARLVLRGTCLTQALSIQLMLARRGRPSTLRFGASKTEGTFSAHAWVEVDGRIVIGSYPKDRFNGFREPGCRE